MYCCTILDLFVPMKSYEFRCFCLFLWCCHCLTKIGDSRSSMKSSPQEFVITGLLSGLLVFPIFCGLVMMPGSSSWPWPSGITKKCPFVNPFEKAWIFKGYC